MRRIVNWVKREYGDVPIYITENGLSDRTGTVEDHRRVNFYKLYINELMKGYADRNSLFFSQENTLCRNNNRFHGIRFL